MRPLLPSEKGTYTPANWEFKANSITLKDIAARIGSKSKGELRAMGYMTQHFFMIWFHVFILQFETCMLTYMS